MSEDLIPYFQNRLPAMLDGAVLQGSNRLGLIRRARAALRKGRVPAGHLPQAILRETLDSIAAAASPATLAGAVPVGPNHARVWWDGRALERLDDAIAQPGGSRLVLRFYDITGIDPKENESRWHETFDIDVRPEETGRTVQFWASDKTYAIELGCVHGDGSFLRLARANPITLPRSGKGAPATGGTATSRLPRPGDKKAAYVAPDAAAAEWAALRPDSERRDRDAELTVHMLYRAFLLEGPRALRRVPALARRGAEVLKSEFAARQLRRIERTAAARAEAAPAVIVHRLDAAAAAGSVAGSAAAAANLPVLVRVAHRDDDTARHVDNESVVLRLSVRPSARILRGDEAVPAALSAAPVFEAAKALRESLAKMSDIPPSRSRFPAAAPATVVDAAQVFDEVETARLIRSGARVSRVSTALEDSLRAASLS